MGEVRVEFLRRPLYAPFLSACSIVSTCKPDMVSVDNAISDCASRLDNLASDVRRFRHFIVEADNMWLNDTAANRRRMKNAPITGGHLGTMGGVEVASCEISKGGFFRRCRVLQIQNGSFTDFVKVFDCCVLVISMNKEIAWSQSVLERFLLLRSQTGLAFCWNSVRESDLVCSQAVEVRVFGRVDDTEVSIDLIGSDSCALYWSKHLGGSVGTR